jgi:membrane protease YdiL (CAAX protease family)
LVKSLVFGSQLKLDSSKTNLVMVILALITVEGFASIVLGPISEEVFIRGFLYGYLRSRIGVGFGLLVQAIIFSVLHLDFSFSVSIWGLVFEGIVLGVLWGMLYEVSGSLYPSILCHSTTNYILIISELLQG